MSYKELNKKAWNDAAEAHFGSEFYNVEGFLNGENSLHETELAALGDVSGKSLLHLQCHFGMDTLSWAQLGAEAVGVGLSDQAISQARELNDRLNLNVEFICSDLYDFGESNSREFDIVYTSYGVLTWLPDLDIWAKTVASSLKSGGTFFIVEFHPAIWLMEGASYFPQDKPYEENWEGYTDKKSAGNIVHEWPHSLGEIVTALLNAGLKITEFSELPFLHHNWLEGSEEREPGKWFRQFKGEDQPIMFTIKATRE